MAHIPRTRRRTMRRTMTEDHDADYHYRLLSGKVAREKKAKKLLNQHLIQKTTGQQGQGGGTNTTTSTTTELTEKNSDPERMLLPPHRRPPILPKKKTHSQLYRLLSGRSRRQSFVIFNRLLAILIVVNVICFVLESIPEVGSEKSVFSSYFYGLEAISSSIFLLEHGEFFNHFILKYKIPTYYYPFSLFSRLLSLHSLRLLLFSCKQWHECSLHMNRNHLERNTQRNPVQHVVNIPSRNVRSSISSLARLSLSNYVSLAAIYQRSLGYVCSDSSVFSKVKRACGHSAVCTVWSGTTARSLAWRSSSVRS